MESSIAVFLMRQHAFERLPTSVGDADTAFMLRRRCARCRPRGSTKRLSPVLTFSLLALRRAALIPMRVSVSADGRGDECRPAASFAASAALRPAARHRLA